MCTPQHRATSFIFLGLGRSKVVLPAASGTDDVLAPAFHPQGNTALTPLKEISVSPEEGLQARHQQV